MTTLDDFVKVPGLGQVALHPLRAGAELTAIAERAKVDIQNFKTGELLSLDPEDAEKLLKEMSARLLTQEEHEILTAYAQTNSQELYDSLMRPDPSNQCQGELLGKRRYCIPIVGEYADIDCPRVPISPWTWSCFRPFIPEK